MSRGERPGDERLRVLFVCNGGYSTQVVVDERYVLRIPSGLDLAGAAPLLCAGITTYSPLRQFDCKRGDHVGVVGLGGLGRTWP